MEYYCCRRKREGEEEEEGEGEGEEGSGNLVNVEQYVLLFSLSKALT